MSFVRFIVFGYAILTIIYFIVSLYSRSIRREKLENEWDETQPAGVSRDDFVEAGLKEYHAGFRKKLILLIFVIPPIIVGVIIYLIN